MIIRYIGIINYNDIKKPININLGGHFIYEICKTGHEWPYIRVEKIIPDYIYDLYRDFKYPSLKSNVSGDSTKVGEVSAIVGQNSAGKTSVLRMISGALREKKNNTRSNSKDNIQYVMIQEDPEKKALYLTVNFHNFNMTKSKSNISDCILDNKYYSSLNELDEKDMLKDKQQIYFSGIFDKSAPLYEAFNLYDISTNTKLDWYLKGQLKSPTDSFDKSISDFKRLEIIERIQLLSSNPEIEDSFMFDFPQKVTLSFMDNENKPEMYLVEKKPSNADEDADKDAERSADTKQETDETEESDDRYPLYDKVNDYFETTYNTLETFFDKLRAQLAVYLIEEVVLTSVHQGYLSYNQIITRFCKKMADRNDPAHVFKRYADQLDLAKELSATDKIKSPVTYDNIDSVPDEEHDYAVNTAYPEFINEFQEHIQEFIDQLTDSDSNIVSNYEFFDDLRSLLISASSVEDDLYKKVDEIMSPFWDGEYGDYYEYEWEEAKSELLDCLHTKSSELDKLKHSLRTLGYSSDEDINISSLDLDKFEYQEMTEVEKDSEYDELDKKIERVSRLYSGFIEIIRHRNVKAFSRIDTEDNELITAEIPLRGKNGGKTACRDLFMTFCSAFFVKETEVEYPDKIETFGIDVDHEDICSGYNGYFDMMARINSISDSINKSGKSDIVLMLDEGELYLHPEAQKTFISFFLSAIPHFFKGKTVQLILSTNSPFILSDIQSPNILYLGGLDAENGLKLYKSDHIGKTFGTNITSLLINDFFMHEGVMGDFAKTKITEIVERLNSDKYTDPDEKDKKIINIIGDDIIRRKLQRVYCEKTSGDSKELYDAEIQRLEERIATLRKRKAEVS